jgi:sulfatase maturation enzyme AslB (radical SAM superfamily)
LHNGFQFHKSDNVPYDRLRVAREIESLIVAMLKTNNVKNWFRAYLNLGLIAKVLGHDRLLPCTAATDFVFVDPWADMFACNVRPDLKLGNLEKQSWDELLNSARANEIRNQVAACQQNCWMVGSAKTAMRHSRFARLPKMGPLMWVIENKVRVIVGQKIEFARFVDYSQAHRDAAAPKRVSHLNLAEKRTLQTKDDAHYVRFGEFFNR